MGSESWTSVIVTWSVLYIYSDRSFQMFIVTLMRLPKRGITLLGDMRRNTAGLRYRVGGGKYLASRHPGVAYSNYFGFILTSHSEHLIPENIS